MATNVSEGREHGIIVLGNSGVGKSFICNLLIGKNEFESTYQPSAITTCSSSYLLVREQSVYTIWNVPGLIEAKQESINENKKQIELAFRKSRYACVIFVWSETSGRLQHDDIIAFNALNTAYQFPEDSVLFVFNNVPSKRPSDYDETFKVLLWKMLGSFEKAARNMLFIEKTNIENTERLQAQGRELWKFIDQGTAAYQEKRDEIMLDVDQIKKLRNGLKELEKTMANERTKLELEREQKKMKYDKSLENVTEKANAAASKLAEKKKTIELNTAAALQMKKLMETLETLDRNYNEQVVTLKKNQFVEMEQIKEKYEEKYKRVTQSYQNDLKRLIQEVLKTASGQYFDSTLPGSVVPQKSSSNTFEPAVSDLEHSPKMNLSVGRSVDSSGDSSGCKCLQ